jgi:hypothetical protein
MDGVSIAHRNIINGAYSYVEKSKETKHIAAAVAYLYSTSLYSSCPDAPPRCPGAPPLSEIADPRSNIPMHYNRPNGMKFLNSMIRHVYNFFKGYENSMNWADTEALADPQCKIFFKARSLRQKLEIVFTTLSGASGPSPSTTKVKAAAHMFKLIDEYIRYPPQTLAEVRLADAEDLFKRREAFRACGGAGCAAADEDAEEEAVAAPAAPDAPAAPVVAVAPFEAAPPAPVTAAAEVVAPRAMDVIRGFGLEFVTSGRNDYQIKRIKKRTDEPRVLAEFAAELAKCGDCRLEMIPTASPRYFTTLCVVWIKSIA